MGVLNLSRRDFLQYAALFVSFPKNARGRLAVTSYPFRGLWESPANRGRNPAVKGMDLKEFPAMAANQFGIYNINPLLDHFASTDAVYLKAFRKAMTDAGSHIVDLGLGGGAFYSSDLKQRDAAIALGRHGVDVASVVGSPSIRQHVRGIKGDKPSVALAAESLGQLAAYGSTRHVVVNLENDDPIAEDPFFLAAVIDKVNSPYLRGLPDFGNSLIGHDADFNRRGVAAMLKRAYNMCHVKDMVESDAGHPVAVDLKKMFELAKQSSYRGYFSMEFDTSQGDPFVGTKKLVTETLQYLT